MSIPGNDPRRHNQIMVGLYIIFVITCVILFVVGVTS